MTLQANAGPLKVMITHGSETMPCKKMVQVQPNQTVDVSCELGPLFGKIELNTTPPRANVSLDGKPLGGKTPMTIKQVKRDEEHTIRIELDGFKPWSRVFDLRDGTTKSFNVELEK